MCKTTTTITTEEEARNKKFLQNIWSGHFHNVCIRSAQHTWSLEYVIAVAIACWWFLYVRILHIYLSATNDIWFCFTRCVQYSTCIRMYSSQRYPPKVCSTWMHSNTHTHRRPFTFTYTHKPIAHFPCRSGRIELDDSHIIFNILCVEWNQFSARMLLSPLFTLRHVNVQNIAKRTHDLMGHMKFECHILPLHIDEMETRYDKKRYEIDTFNVFCVRFLLRFGLICFSFLSIVTFNQEWHQFLLDSERERETKGKEKRHRKIVRRRKRENEKRNHIVDR